MLLLCVAIGLSGAAPQQSDAVALFKKISSSVFVVEALDARGAVGSFGSGVAVGPNDLVTNWHVVEKATRIRIRKGPLIWTARVSRSVPGRDLARITVRGLDARSVSLRSSTTLEVGERVYAVGSAGGLELTFSEGLISGLRSYGDSQLIQSTAPISPGSSGGGLFDHHGRLTGITTFEVKEGQNLNFALPADWVAELLRADESTDLAADYKLTGETLKAFKWFLVGYEAAESGDWDAAIRAYEQSLQFWPDSAPTIVNLGNAYSERGDTERALTTYQRAIGLAPGYAPAWNNMAVLHEKLGRYEEAVDAYRRCVSIDPYLWHAWGGLAGGLNSLGRHAEQLQALQEVVRLRPDHADSWGALGYAYSELGRHQDAIDAYRKGVSLDPDNSLFWANLASAYASLGRPAERLAALREAVRTKPEWPDAWFRLALALADQDDPNGAMEAYRRLKELDPQRAKELWLHIGWKVIPR